MKSKSNCECCINYTYSEEYDCYECEASLDEDEMVRFLSSAFDNCPYFQLDDEYKLAGKQ